MNRADLVLRVVIHSPLLALIAVAIVGGLVCGAGRAVWEWLR